MSLRFPIGIRRSSAPHLVPLQHVAIAARAGLAGFMIITVLAACMTPLPTLLSPGTSPSSAPSEEPTAVVEAGSKAVVAPPTSCGLPPVIPPTPPPTIPGYTQLDPTTNLHMTGTVQEIDLTSYRLKVSGKVNKPLSLSYDELRCMPRAECRCTLVCPGFFTDEAAWAGVPLAYVLRLAGIQEGATTIRLLGADGYGATVQLQAALAEGNFLAYEWEGQPLPILHGFPLRAVFPGQGGSLWVKWLLEIRVE
jgi:DMSO/TMAO reductase YedYZ molybdopterin-dependent catalytic subunit